MTEMFVLLSKEAHDEYRLKKLEITNLKRCGAHDAEISYLTRELKKWARAQVAEMRGGNWLVPTPP